MTIITVESGKNKLWLFIHIVTDHFTNEFKMVGIETWANQTLNGRWEKYMVIPA